MTKRATIIALVGFLLGCAIAFAQGPCPAGSSKLACVIPLEYGVSAGTPPQPFSGEGLFQDRGHVGHFDNSLKNLLGPVTREIGRQANLLPLASPSSGVVLTYDPGLKTFVTSTDSLGPILGERAETVGLHRFFVGFSYQFFDFDRIDNVDLRNFPVYLVHADDNVDNSNNVSVINCQAATNKTTNVNGCAYIRDLISTVNSIDLKINQYTAYVTFGLTPRVDLSLVIPFEDIRMKVSSSAHILLGTDGNYPVRAGTPDAMDHPTPPRFDHLFKNCANYPGAATATALDATCLNHTFPDPAFSAGSSQPRNSAFGIGDLVARVKWNLLHGERANVAAGVDVRFPTGDALNFLGSGSYGVKPFVVFSYRARISPHVLAGFEWNSDSITAGDLTTNVKGSVPNDFVYSGGVDARITKWLTGSFDIVGQRIFNTQTLSVTSQEFLAPCGPCSFTPPARPNPDTIVHDNLQLNHHSFSITNASMGIKLRPFPKVSRLVVTANVLVRLDEGGLHSKPAPLIGLGYTF